VEVPLTNGKTLVGVVVSGTPEEVVLRVGEQERRVPWIRLAPLGFFRCHRALAPIADGDAHARLAELAVDLGLYVEAREEYEKTLALGAIQKKDFEERVLSAERAAVENGVARARQLAESGDLEEALDVARALRQHFSEAPNAAAIQKLVADLVTRIREIDAEAAQDRAELEAIKVASRREKEIVERRTRVSALIAEARGVCEEAARYRQQGSVTRARKLAEQADDLFQQARLHLGRLRRILPRESEAGRDVLADLERLDTEQFALRFATARFFADSKTWSTAERWLMLASYIDPVNPELVQLREEIASVRIRYRASDITNARPIVR